MQSAVSLTYVTMANTYLNAREGRRVAWWIVGANAVILLAWHRKRVNITRMTRRWTHNPLNGKSYTLLTSMFRCDISRPMFDLLTEKDTAIGILRH